MSVMILRFIHLPEKGCFAELLKRPTETSDATVSVHGESVQDESVAPDLCVGRRSLFLPIFNRSVFSVSHTFGTNPKSKKRNTRKARKPRNTHDHLLYFFVLFQLKKRNEKNKKILKKHTKGTKHTKPYFQKFLLSVGTPHQRGIKPVFQHPVRSGLYLLMMYSHMRLVPW
jgi:hypothetical protein